MKITNDFQQRKINSLKFNNLSWRRAFGHKPDEIEKRNIKLRKTQSQLYQIKENSIKDIIYSHKTVPISWKSKFNYKDQVMNLIANDDNFLVYLGNIGGNPNIAKSISSYANNIKSENYENLKKKNKNKIKLFRNKSMDSRELDIYLTKLGKNYPIKGKLKDLFSETVLMSLDSTNKINLKKNNNNKLLSFKYITTEKKKNDINKNIYVQLTTNKTRNSDKSKVRRAQSAITKNYNKKYLDKENYNRRKLYIKDRYAMNQIESINFYGPYFSYCPECGPRNLDFYKNIDTNTLIEIVGQIKKNKDEQILKTINRKKHVKK